jgi:hypothetical protein
MTKNSPSIMTSLITADGAAAADDDDVGALAADAVDAGEDIEGLRARELVTSFGTALARSGRLTREGAGLAVELVKVGAGRSGIEPARGDWRFKDRRGARTSRIGASGRATSLRPGRLSGASNRANSTGRRPSVPASSSRSW